MNEAKLPMLVSACPECYIMWATGDPENETNRFAMLENLMDLFYLILIRLNHHNKLWDDHFVNKLGIKSNNIYHIDVMICEESLLVSFTKISKEEYFCGVDVEKNKIDGKPVLKFASAYGFINIQNLFRKIKSSNSSYHYVEVSRLCPSS
ncbi:hypothetical protein C1645_819371 [Glomus cerebriforme]|uniref:Iron hydrogenase large subunit C-terminal domain-containing protein n=1 Tax=Glomus cerebriforme TaxID=658196 RepID=A0A397T7W6_9GLOM|nr:hypothetical protein C1645_819371 [Glomus cerebriforme]